MKILIAEDEALAAERLSTLVMQGTPDAEIVDTVDTVKDIISFFTAGRQVDLLMLDIQLADGKCFEVFDTVTPDIPIIFTTAFDEYALQAFRFHSIDYLLKPVQPKELDRALKKFQKLTAPKALQPAELVALRDALFPASKVYKERFIIKSGNKLQYRLTHEVSYFFAEGKEVYLVASRDSRKYLIDHTLDELEQLLDPKSFFRISRKFIINIACIAEVRGLMSTRLELKLLPAALHELFVSRERAHEFKTWLDN